jgi:CheY-like chemotaxis protein
MSHEIRTPLNGILGMAQALEHSQVQEPAKTQIKLIRQSGEMLLTLLNEILDHAKIEARVIEFNPQPCNIAGVINSSISIFHTTAEEKGISLRVDLSEVRNAVITADPLRIRQCVTNLVSNAIKFTEHGEIVVKAAAMPTSAAGHVKIQIDITDTGIGMTKAECEKIFGAFEQADSSTTRRFGGTGLGLAIAKRIALAMSGDINVKSAPEHGSTFSFVFTAPLSIIEGVRPAAAERPVPSPAQKTRILLVEDNQVNREVAKALLSSLSAEIEIAENGRQAIEKLHAAHFDLVLMDIQMPVMDGLTATRKIRTAERPWSMVPILALTAGATDGDRNECFEAGMNDYLAKPLKAAELLAKVSKALGADASDAARRPPAREIA